MLVVVVVFFFQKYGRMCLGLIFKNAKTSTTFGKKFIYLFRSKIFLKKQFCVSFPPPFSFGGEDYYVRGKHLKGLFITLF